jgi:hypothetical protein
MKKTIGDITIQLTGSLIIFKNKDGDTFKCIDAVPNEALSRYNGYVKQLEDRWNFQNGVTKKS